MEAALRWKAQYGQAPQKSSEEVAMEAALRWKAKYGHAPEQVHAKDRTHERQQIELTPTPATHTRGKDFDLSL